MKFKYLTKDEERIIFDEGIKKRIDYKGKEVFTNIHEDCWTRWNNYNYDKKIFESGKEWRKGKLRYQLNIKGQVLKIVNILKKVIKIITRVARRVSNRISEIHARTIKFDSV